MALTQFDRNLLLRCLGRKPGAWEAFVDRFMGLVVHVVQSTAKSRGMTLSPADQDDLCAEVFLAIVQNDFALLRHFRGQSSLATYLAVVGRRVVVRELVRRHQAAQAEAGAGSQQAAGTNGHESPVEEQAGNREEVERMMQSLSEPEARVVQLFHLEGKTYAEISRMLGKPENTIGPLLSRARQKMRSLRPRLA